MIPQRGKFSERIQKTLDNIVNKCYTVNILFFGKEAGRMFVHIIRYITSGKIGVFTGTDNPPVLSI